MATPRLCALTRPDPAARGTFPQPSAPASLLFPHPALPLASSGAIPRRPGQGWPQRQCLDSPTRKGRLGSQPSILPHVRMFTTRRTGSKWGRPTATATTGGHSCGKRSGSKEKLPGDLSGAEEWAGLRCTAGAPSRSGPGIQAFPGRDPPGAMSEPLEVVVEVSARDQHTRPRAPLRPPRASVQTCACGRRALTAPTDAEPCQMERSGKPQGRRQGQSLM